jgi:hypothetical protein
MFVNRLGESFTAHPWVTPWRATKLEVRILRERGRGLFVHTEMVQPRRRDAQAGLKNDAIAPQPGFPDAQLDRLALLYVAASFEHGTWMIPAFHATVDAGIPNAHDDPQNFDLQRWADSLKALLKALSLPKASSTPSGASNPSKATPPDPSSIRRNAPELIAADGNLQFAFGKEVLVVPRGLQPSMLCTTSGTLIVQAQIPEKPFPSSRMTYLSAMDTFVSRDGGESWQNIPLKPGENGLAMEGGATQLRDGTIIALDTYITPGAQPNQGLGQLYRSTNDWRTLDGPMEISFDLPQIDFYGSSDDGGRPHAAQRLHRRILELPNGDLLTTFYGRFTGDDTPSTYNPKMKKTRVLLARSSDRGLHWKLISTVAADPNVGTEGYDEPVIARISRGEKAGRLICLMRTGRELRETTSDDEGITWAPPYPRVFASLDVYRTELWVDMLRQFKDFKGKLLDDNNPDELRGAVVDPDLIELRSGLLVAAFGVRVPQKLCWQHPEHSWNGNYLAVSRDHGKSWSNVIRMTSGVLTTHYMAIEEAPTDNKLFVTYDLGGWSKGMRRDVYGRTVEITVKDVKAASR